MKDEDLEEKLKDIEKEIDSAIDQLFVDKVAEEPPAQAMMDMGPETSTPEEESSAGPTSEALDNEVEPAKPEDAGETGITEKYSDVIDTLQSKVEAFTEWGVTDVALEKILSEIHEIKNAFGERKLLASVVSMITEVLNFLKENPTSHVPELVEFLSNALNAIKKLIHSADETSPEDKELYDAINTQFSEISTLLTFDIDTIELEERFALPGDEGEKLEETESKENIEPIDLGIHGSAETSQKETAAQEMEESGESEEKGEREKIVNLSMSFLEPTDREAEVLEGDEGAAPEKEQAEALDVGIFDMKKVPSETSLDEVEARGSVETAEGERQPIPPASVVASSPIEKFHELTDELRETFKSVEKVFFESHTIPELMEKLTVAMEALKSHTNRLLTVKSAGVQSENELKQLQNTVSELRDDFESLSELLAPEGINQFNVEEIVPVVVGKKMVGVSTKGIGQIYSISKTQEEKFLREGKITLKGESIPVVNLFEEFAEVSQNPNKRLIVVNGTNGSRALLADKVLKRCFALVSGEPGAHDVRTVKFYVVEEIPLYEIP